MQNVVLVGCGAYMDSGYGCPGEWRCLKAAALGEGKFTQPARVIAFARCECPGRSLVSNILMAIKLSEIKPDGIYVSNCMAFSTPACPYSSMENMASAIEKGTGVPVILGTHNYA